MMPSMPLTISTQAHITQPVRKSVQPQQHRSVLKNRSYCFNRSFSASIFTWKQSDKWKICTAFQFDQRTKKLDFTLCERAFIATNDRPL